MNKRIWLLPKIEWAELQALFYKPPKPISNSLEALIGQVYMLKTGREI